MDSSIELLSKVIAQYIDRDGIERTLHKLLSCETSLLQNHLKDRQQLLREYEDTYDMSSEVFIEKWEAGERSDDDNFFEWFALVDTTQRSLNLSDELKG